MLDLHWLAARMRAKPSFYLCKMKLAGRRQHEYSLQIEFVEEQQLASTSIQRTAVGRLQHIGPRLLDMGRIC